MDAAAPARFDKFPPPKAVVERARTVFRDRFGAEPQFLASAPGRVNLIGEHTDYNGGFVLPMAIDRVCAVAAAPASRPGRWRIHSADLGQDAELNVAGPLVPGALARGLWISYIAGVAAGFQQLLGDQPLPALDIAIASSVPPGSGLSSSAALEVAIATLLEGVLDSPLVPLDKALLCQRAEHNFAGVPCGLMDQLTAATGQAGHALLIDCRSNTAAPVPLPPSDQAAVVVIDSGVRHALATGEYASRRATCESAAAKLKVGQLRELPDVPRSRTLSDEETRCVRHVVSENRRTAAAAEALRKSDLPVFGRLMLESHTSLRDDYRVSCSELDAIVAAASAVAGVFGARMTGAGFGGCAVALLRPGAVPAVCGALAGLARAAFIAQPSAGARLVEP